MIFSSFRDSVLSHFRFQIGLKGHWKRLWDLISIIVNPVRFTFVHNSHELDAFKMDLSLWSAMPSHYSGIQSWPYNLQTLEGENGCEFPKTRRGIHVSLYSSQISRRWDSAVSQCRGPSACRFESMHVRSVRHCYVLGPYPILILGVKWKRL